MIHEINKIIWLRTPKGLAIAHFLIDRGSEADLEWVCFQQDTGEVWCWNNSDVRVEQNITLGRKVGPR